MSLSRFRLHLAARFGSAFAVGLLLLDAGFYLYARHRAEGRLSEAIEATARGISDAIRNEAKLHPDDDRAAVDEVLGEWPLGVGAVQVWTAAGEPLGGRGPARLRRVANYPSPLPAGFTLRRAPLDEEGDARIAIYRDSAPAGYAVAAVASSSTMREEEEVLAGWLLLSMPLVGLLALSGGYVLAKRALTPLELLSARVAGIDPHALDSRLPVRAPPDEIDALAGQFNHLLTKLEEAQAVNRTFLARAAHQLKTPLTVVQGESALGLERHRTVEEYEAILRRVQLSAEQMDRRVRDLMLLARASAGDRPPIRDDVELDGLVWQCADLMRARAQATRHHLELGAAESVVIRGNEDLLREACLELIENACRHALPESTIRLSVTAQGHWAELAVGSAGQGFETGCLEPGRMDGRVGGLGLTIVKWIAEMHGGGLATRRHADGNLVIIRLPTRPTRVADSETSQ